jgi:5-methyltetrahydrofolate--homocysteine methyltransferase
VEEVASWIDWGPFFLTWGLRASWTRQLDDPEHGERYRELLDDARAMLDELANTGSLQLRGVYGFFSAVSEGDDLVVHGTSGETVRFPMLRQQERRPEKRGPQLSLSDFVAPSSLGLVDHVGAFAVTAGHGLIELVARYERDHDDYRVILANSLADRLAEALTEKLHARMRSEWGIGDPPGTTLDDCLASKFRGIRPAFGYPACPDHTSKGALFALLDATRRAGIELTEHFAMWPAASVSGLVFAHPEARYFGVGAIGRDQVEDYAVRKGMSVQEVERWLAPQLAYDPAPGRKSAA